MDVKTPPGQRPARSTPVARVTGGGTRPRARTGSEARRAVPATGPPPPYRPDGSVRPESGSPSPAQEDRSGRSPQTQEGSRRLFGPLESDAPSRFEPRRRPVPSRHPVSSRQPSAPATWISQNHWGRRSPAVRRRPPGGRPPATPRAHRGASRPDRTRSRRRHPPESHPQGQGDGAQEIEQQQHRPCLLRVTPILPNLKRESRSRGRGGLNDEKIAQYRRQ